MAASCSASDRGRPRAGRRRLLGVLAGGVVAASMRAAWADDVVTLRLGHGLPPGHPVQTRLAGVAARFATETHGRVRLLVFPDGELGDDRAMFGALRAGTLDLQAVPGAVLAEAVPAAGITGVGFVFADQVAVWRTLDGPLGGALRDAIAASGLHPFARVWNGGFNQICSEAGPVAGPEALRGLPIRVPPGPAAALFSAFGAVPRVIAEGDLYAALQARLVRAASVPLAVIETGRLYEVQRGCALTAQSWDGLWLLAAPAALARLSTADAATLARLLDEAALLQRADLAALDERLAGMLAGQGVALATPAKAPFRDALTRAGYYDACRRRFGDAAWGLLQAGTVP